MKQVFAANAWLGPGKIIKRALLTIDERVQKLETLENQTAPPDAAVQVQWLLPGFINAHCHLEYTWLKDKLPRGPMPFGQWLEAIMTLRFSDPGAEDRELAMQCGARTLLAGGCTTVLDSSTDGASQAILERHAIKHHIFHEVLGLTKERAKQTWEHALAQVYSFEKSKYSLGNSLNPHAPYSVGRWLRQELLNEQHPDVSPLRGYAWHLAETPDEDELFLTGKGSISAFLKLFKMPMPFDDVPGQTAAQFLAHERLLESADIIFHGNTLANDEATNFAAPRALVHCPSTHRWFDRKPIPLLKWMRSGVNICLGTDSLASSDTLSMLAIVRMTLEDHPELTADEALQMACINPTKISFLQPHNLNFSSLFEGNKPAADFIALDSSAEAEDLSLVLKSTETIVSQIWIQGTPRL